MRKIPTLFMRDFDHGKPYLTDHLRPDAAWVMEGIHPATRKYDGTCVLIDHGLAFTRREVKKGKVAPPFFILLEQDFTTGKSVGWEPASQSGFWKLIEPLAAGRPDGTYELIGEKVNGNPERILGHLLVLHANAQVLAVDTRSFKTLKIDLTALARDGIEGVVWHNADGRMAKLKGRDFQ